MYVNTKENLAMNKVEQEIINIIRKLDLAQFKRDRENLFFITGEICETKDAPAWIESLARLQSLLSEIGVKLEVEQATRFPKCEAHYINACECIGTIELKTGRGKSCGFFCSEACANEHAGEISEGTWCPYPDASNALTQDQIEENLTYFRE